MTAVHSNKVSFPRLDALRALCFLAVFLFHSFHTEEPALLNSPLRRFVKGFLLASGDLGVNVFFVLSGFLITFLLIRERALNGRVHVSHFWVRRLLRIWPLYFLCVAFGFLVFPWIKSALGAAPAQPPDLWYYLLFAVNFDLLGNGMPDASSLAVLWSVAVEEQFYLVWPILLSVLPTRLYPVLFASIVSASVMFNARSTDHLVTLLHTFSCMGDLAMGAFGAWLLSRQGPAERLRQLPGWSVILIHATLIVLFLVRTPLVVRGCPDGLLRLAVAVAATAVVLCQAVGSGGFPGLPAQGPLSYLGRISFGLYCLHPVGLLAAVHGLELLGLDRHVWQILVLQPLVALVVTTGLAAASYHFFESPFLRLRSRFATIVRPTGHRPHGF